MEAKFTSHAVETAEPWIIAYNKLILSQPRLTEPYFQPMPETYNIKRLCADMALERADFAAIVEKRPQDAHIAKIRTLKPRVISQEIFYRDCGWFMLPRHSTWWWMDDGAKSSAEDTILPVPFLPCTWRTRG